MRKKKRRNSGALKRINDPRIAAGLFITIFVCAAAAFWAYHIRYSAFFQIKTIETDVAIGTQLEKKIKGTSLFDVDIEGIYKKIRYRHPELKRVFIKKVFPSTLKIETVSRKPFVQLKEDGFYLLDKEYVALKKAERAPFKGVMTVEMGDYPHVIRKGSALKDMRLALSYKLVEELHKSILSRKFEITSINATRADSISFFMDDVNVIVGRGDFAKKIFLLENLLKNKFNNDITSLRYIDLRFASSAENIYIGNKR